MTARMFPIMRGQSASPHPNWVPWEVAERAYEKYVAKYGRCQSLERIGERGGFSPSEMEQFAPGWDKVEEKAQEAP